MNTSASSKSKLRILVINDFLPDPTTDDGWRLTQILQALQELGHEVTFIARDGKNQQALEPTLRESGIEAYSGDFERLPALGKDVINVSWSLEAILADKQFNVAILIQNFRCGISVPEHYLDAIRKHSPQTRVIVWNEALYERSARRRAEITQRLEHCEIAKDWFARGEEALHRSDMVVVRHSGDEAWLQQNYPAIHTSVVPLSVPYSEELSWKKCTGILLTLDLTQPGDVDGFAWFLKEIWPTIYRASSDLELLVCGAERLPDRMRQKLTRVQWLEAKDSEPIRDPRVFIAPLRFGKVADTLAQMVAHGTPGVMTAYVAESAGFKPASGILLANTPEEFAVLVLQLYQDPEKWKDVSAGGLKFAQKQFSWEGLKCGLQNALTRVQGLTPKPAGTEPFSMTQVDTLFGEALSKAPRERLGGVRLDGHVQLAQELLRDGKAVKARAQLRHVFSWLGESLQYSAPLARLLSVLARCYRELGDHASVTVCAQQARRCFVDQCPPKTQRLDAIKVNRNAPLISLILPTFNRLPILKKCLAALEIQTFPTKDFEVIVIDDGSSDGTEAMMRQYCPPFRLQYLRQTNSGTGAARRNGVAHANGEYLLLMNDDTICDPDLIEQHMRVQRECVSERWAVLGNFEYPAEAHRRAFTHFLRTSSFMFPQIDMEAGFPYPYSHFITCNLSIPRLAVIDAGSFDSTYKLSEDTELGIRLFEMGYGVLYHPAAHAWHDHLPYAVGNLIRRARVYGADYFYMFRRHPRVIGEWAMPVDLTGMNVDAAQRIQQYLEANRSSVEKAAAALDQWDNVEFEPFLARPQDAAQVMALFRQAVPAVHWFYLLEKMLETMVRELNLSLPATATSFVMSAAQSSG